MHREKMLGICMDKYYRKQIKTLIECCKAIDIAIADFERLKALQTKKLEVMMRPQNHRQPLPGSLQTQRCRRGVPNIGSHSEGTV
jgi:hypothetical protein